MKAGSFDGVREHGSGNMGVVMVMMGKEGDYFSPKPKGVVRLTHLDAGSMLDCMGWLYMRQEIPAGGVQVWGTITTPGN